MPCRRLFACRKRFAAFERIGGVPAIVEAPADFVRELCADGETVRLEELPGAGHFRASRISASSAIQWIQARIDGRAPPNGCAPRPASP